MTGCLLGTVFRIPSTTSLPQKSDDRPFTTTPKNKVILDIPALTKIKSSRVSALQTVFK